MAPRPEHNLFGAEIAQDLSAEVNEALWLWVAKLGGKLHEDLVAGRQRHLLDQDQQPLCDGIDLQEADPILLAAINDQVSRLGRRLIGLPIRPHAVHREAIGQTPGEWREDRVTGYEVSSRIEILVCGLLVTSLERKLDPLVVRQLQQKRRVARISGTTCHEELEKLLRQLQEQGRLGPVPDQEIAYQIAPSAIADDPLDNREAPRQERRHIVEDEIAIDRHPVMSSISVISRPGEA